LYTLNICCLKPIDFKSGSLERPNCISTTGSRFPIIIKIQIFFLFSFNFKYHDIEEWVDQLFYRLIQVPKRVKNTSYLIKLRKPTLGKVEDIGSHVDRAKTPATI